MNLLQGLKLHCEDVNGAAERITLLFRSASLHITVLIPAHTAPELFIPAAVDLRRRKPETRAEGWKRPQAVCGSQLAPVSGGPALSVTPNSWNPAGPTRGSSSSRWESVCSVNREVNGSQALINLLAAVVAYRLLQLTLARQQERPTTTMMYKSEWSEAGQPIRALEFLPVRESRPLVARRAADV